jgi:hypothetical protein
MSSNMQLEQVKDRIVYRAYICNHQAGVETPIFPPKSYGKTSNFRTVKDAEKRLEIETNKILRSLPITVNARNLRLQGRIYKVVNGKREDDFYCLALN